MKMLDITKLSVIALVSSSLVAAQVATNSTVAKPSLSEEEIERIKVFSQDISDTIIVMIIILLFIIFTGTCCLFCAGASSNNNIKKCCMTIFRKPDEQDEDEEEVELTKKASTQGSS